MSYLKMSSWRKTNTVLKSGLNEITFNDTKPNVFYVVNTNNTYIYFGAGTIPTAQSYEWRVKPNSTDAFGRPLPTGKLYIINPTDAEINIEVYSDEQDFDISLLKNLNANMDDEQIERMRFDGIVRGFDTTDVVHTKVDLLPTALTDLLTANHTEVVTKLVALSDKLDDVMEHIDALKGIDTTAEVKMGELSFTEGVATITFDSPVIDLITLSNDTDKDVVVTMSRDTNSQTFTLKQGEVLDNIGGINIMSISASAEDVTGVLRYIVKKGVV